MKQFDVITLILLAACAALCATQPLAASEFEVVAATGVLEPAGLQAGKQLAEGTRLALEPWGRALIREKAKCQLTHVVIGLDDYVLTLSEDCSPTEEPMSVAARLQQGEVFTALLKETGSGPADEIVSALVHEPCVFLARFSGRLKTSSISWRGPYCDDLLPQPFKSSRLTNAKACEWSAWDSEQQPGTWIDCKLGKFVAGMRCRDDYCADVGLYCCEAKVE